MDLAHHIPNQHYGVPGVAQGDGQLPYNGTTGAISSNHPLYQLIHSIVKAPPRDLEENKDDTSADDPLLLYNMDQNEINIHALKHYQALSEVHGWGPFTTFDEEENFTEEEARIIELYHQHARQNPELKKKRLASEIPKPDGAKEVKKRKFDPATYYANKTKRDSTAYSTTDISLVKYNDHLAQLDLEQHELVEYDESEEPTTQIEPSLERPKFHRVSKDITYAEIIAREIVPAYTRVMQTSEAKTNTAYVLASSSKDYMTRKLAKVAVRMNSAPQRCHAMARNTFALVKRNERDWKRRADKETELSRKQEEDGKEKERQQKKLNFLLTQTELYSHFMLNKMNGDKQHVPVMAAGLEDRQIQEEAHKMAMAAVADTQQKMESFDRDAQTRRSQVKRKTGGLVTKPILTAAESSGMVTQSARFEGQLKGYQVKGLNWLLNLYNQGINGILADDMGLGKTVQTVALLSYLAEERNIWGPFIVIAPTSTLPNWANEVSKFAPHLNVLPYWGTAKQRKSLRKLIYPKYLHKEDSPVHVFVTSYNLITIDEKYFRKINWEYMILDEAHAIKNSGSVRWNTLLKFVNCRNRLLLTGTPIQNNMGELWALLHFIMPTLFDSHAEFSEWFSKDIENHAETNAAINEHQLNRLHMILKPFMLRRVKKDIENEMPPKFETEVKCELAPRQYHMYTSIKKNMSLGDLLNKGNYTEKHMKHLMNLVMKFRKVCNHPELFERTETISPFQFTTVEAPIFSPNTVVAAVNKNPIRFSIAKLIYREAMANVHAELSGTIHPASTWLTKKLNIWTPENINDSLHHRHDNCWSFLRFTNTSPATASWLYNHNAAERAYCQLLWEDRQERTTHLLDSDVFSPTCPPTTHEAAWRTRNMLCITPVTSPGRVQASKVLSALIQNNALQRLVDNHELIYHTKNAHFPPALAPVIDVCCSDRQFQTQQLVVLKHAWLMRQLAGYSCQRNTPDDRLRLPLELARFVSASPLQKGPSPLEWHRGKPLTVPQEVYASIYSTRIIVPKFSELVRDSGKLKKLDGLLKELKQDKHRVLIYSQMTSMLDILEDFLYVRGYKFIRLDGSSKLDDRRDMVDQFQNDPSIYIFLLSTRAGGLGINLTSADTVIFYDSDWNPTMDAQAMDRAHRLGQTRPVHVYRLITSHTVEEKILMRAKQKHTIQNIVIAGGKFEMQEGEGMEDEPIFNQNEMMDLLDDELDPSQKKKLATRRNTSALSGLGVRRSAKPSSQKKSTGVQDHKVVLTKEDMEVPTNATEVQDAPDVE